MKKIVLIPAYEPDDKLIELVNKLYKEHEIVLVNDGSSNKEIFEKLEEKCTILTHNVNKGKGEALKTGFQYIMSNYNEKDSVITVDADGQHKYEDILNLLNITELNEDALVLGVRTFGKGTPFRSILGNKITSKIFKHYMNYDLGDTQTGLRSFKVSLTPFLLNIEGSRYEYEMNMLIQCVKKEIPFIQIPITTIYLDNNKNSHYKTIKDSYRIYKLIRKYK